MDWCPSQADTAIAFGKSEKPATPLRKVTGVGCATAPHLIAAAN